jgi:hypothetical protein
MAAQLLLQFEQRGRAKISCAAATPGQSHTDEQAVARRDIFRDEIRSSRCGPRLIALIGMGMPVSRENGATDRQHKEATQRNPWQDHAGPSRYWTSHSCSITLKVNPEIDGPRMKNGMIDAVDRPGNRHRIQIARHCARFID